MTRPADLLSLVPGRPSWAALLFGAVAACGFEPLHLWPLTLVALALLIELIARAGSWQAAARLGWLFGLGHFTIANNWIATAFTYQAQMPVWLGGIAVAALALYLAVYPMLAALCAWLFARRVGAGALVPGFAAFWIISEWLRSWVFTGFAWNPLSMVLLGGFDGQGLAILAPWTGTYGLSGLAVLLAAWLRHLVCVFPAAQLRQRVILAGWSVPLAAITIAAMIAPASYLPPPQGGVPFTLVQPDIRQEVLNDPAAFERNFRTLARLSVPRVPEQRRLVLWPESGVPDYLREGYPAHVYRSTTFAAEPGLARSRIGQVIGGRALLLTGAVDLVIADGDPVGARNVITAIDSKGNIQASYAKAHLVPFGEYLALRWLLEPLGASRLVAGSLDFHPGPGPRSTDFGPWGKAGMQICYEIIFSGQVVERAQRPDYIFNPSNDGWFGTWGPPQHLAQARMRAIEEGLPVLRATTTGISAVIDADGIVRDHVPHRTAGRIDGRIPFAHEPTLFARSGNLLPLAIAAMLLIASLVALRRSRG